jgi:hypothetical protein
MVRHTADSDKPETAGKIKGDNNGERMRRVVFKIIEENISQPRPYQKPRYCPYRTVLDSFLRPVEAFIVYPVDDKKIDNKKSYKVCKTVITELEGTYLQKCRINMLRNMLPEIDQGVSPTS